ncbi:AlwI family type II restriction endonuclease [Roseburia faecis]|uniref:AlwI family type II restriction endonuclease n=1 Tax=Roseburia faecis TaxID=301302 RepID=UPI003F9B7CE3
MAKAKITQLDIETYSVVEQQKRMTEYGEKLIDVERIVKKPIDIWLIGNTGMRNPWRIPSGFKVYAESNMVGRLRSPEDQVAFKMLLVKTGEIGGDLDKDKDASITRKYRLMFNKYGFAYPEVTKKDGFDQEELGPVDVITPLGETFYNADTVSAQQECFLRGLIVPMEKLDDNRTFSPLLWVLSVMLSIEKRVGDTKINFIEFATCVQTTTPLNDVEKVVDAILKIREERKGAENKKKYDRELIDKAFERYLKQKGNFKDYADMNIRYLISSGIVKRAGRGLSLVPEYHSMAIELIKDVVSTESLKERYKKLCEGAPLPTDNEETANKVLNDLIAELEYYGIEYKMPDIPLDSAKNINMVRASLKKDIDKFKEEQYAKQQYDEWKEIYEYMNLLISNNGKELELEEDYVIKVPKSEAAAYLEWTLWRAFLAIDHTINKPYEARGFNIDQDYLPVGTAPGGGSDMVFEFEDYVIAVEVTMSTNSRQEAMEGEPVRRHVADLVLNNEKPVYGVFVANKIDSNTAETFRIGVWYNQNDEKMALRIVPFTLKQFSEYFKFMFENKTVNPDVFLELFNKCFEAKDGKGGPEWKQEIANIINSNI